MKKLTASLIVFLILITSSIYTQNDFTLGFTGSYPHNYNNPVTLQHDWGWYNDLNMNTWSGWWIGGNWGTSATGTQQVLSRLAQYDIDGYLQPDTIRWAGYGRVMVTEAEITNDRFKYNNHHTCGRDEQDNTQWGTGQMVRYYNKNSLCNEEESPSGLILSELNENLFQSLANFPYDPKYQVPFPYNNYNGYSRDTVYLNKYYVKPRMRISTSDAFSNPPKNVVKIIIKKFNGQPGPEFILTTEDFRFNNSNTYDGRYLEDYFNRILSVNGDVINEGRGVNYVPLPEQIANCHVDYQIYWYGEVSVWIDYVKVMDEAAYRLLNPNPFLNLDDVLQEKINFIKNLDTEGRMKGFYMEEVDYTNIACLKYLNDNLPVWANDPDYKMISLINWISFRGPLREGKSTDYADFMDAVQPNAVMYVAYPFEGPYGPHPPKLPENISYFFQSYYPSIIQTHITAAYNSYKTTPALYNQFLQSQCWDFYDRRFDTINSLCKARGIEFYLTPQVHTWKDPGLTIDQSHREPMNSELGALFNIGICHGIKGIMPFAYESGYSFNQPLPRGGNGVIENAVEPQTCDGYSYSFGMTDFESGNHWGVHKRDTNFYGENKWKYVKDHYAKIKTWEPVVFNSANTEGYSVHNEGAAHGFIQDIQSILPGINGQNPCVEDYPGGPYMDCTDERYWELGFFDDIGATKYFMAVNRRCVPAGGGYAGDDRLLRIKFDANDLPQYTSWKISEVSNSITVNEVTFSKYYNGYVDLGSTNGGMGWFKPGEGKLFKLEPVLPSGGTLVADEVISGESFTCEAPVYNNGFNITIGANTTIHFNDSSKFVMNGGVFTVGNQNVSGSQNITCDAVNGTSWPGHSFTNCEVKIYGANFTGITNDTAYSLNIVDCPVVDIRNCTFNNAQSLKGAVNAVFYNNPFAAVSNVYLYGNTFNSSGSTIPTVNISSYAGLTLPLIIEGNTFNNGNTAIFLTGVTGGAIKGNTITDNYYGLNVLTSSVDIFENNISSSVNGSIGIFSAGGSEIRLNKAGSLLIGGQNTITNTGSASNNIKVEGAVFLLADGENIFDIASNQSAYHLYGWFPLFSAVSYDETDNCFKIDNSPVDPPVNLVTDGYQGSALSFTFQPYLTGCEIPDGGDGFVINLGDGIYDTLYNEGQGTGGSRSSVVSVRRTDIKQNSQTHAFDLPSAKNKYDSISVLLRYRNYPLARTKCIDLINTYPDSIQSLNAISKLFLATTATDTTINGANELKIYYENLILNNPNNVSLVKRANYFILKCKVRMRQYSQALAGFQQIINQNPYSYEGLIARWDYMATSLLVQGQGGGEPSITNYELGITNDNQFDESDKSEKFGDDRNPFTKEQRQDIRKSINTAIEISKNDDEAKMKTLEQRSQLGDVYASRELSQRNSLKQVVKTEKPQNILQHVRIISEDIRKVFGEGTSLSKINPNTIPTVYRLSQNYPNPFNPVTKINYDLPRDAKVTIIIYDILGREVKRLVNNEIKKAGVYIVDFNALNYASGVYFYRIEAEETGGFKFVDSKKMVLLK